MILECSSARLLTLSLFLSSIILALIQSFTSLLNPFSPIDFVVGYIMLPISAIIYVFFKILHRTRM